MRKKALPSAIPPPLELECLRVLWRLEAANVSQVREALLGRHVLAYTTVMTLLDRLARKGAAQRKKTGRYFVYRPAVDRETLRRAALAEMADRYFDGNEGALRSWVSGAPPPDAQRPEPEPNDDLETVLL
ncbi:MAG: BlaI/MecI/CopY family transcriptional regulator [Bryobacteraceae bacterium]|nr:BlaI/MecI/CopY family transcriptional regulator [Bryobacteraceae bacterium]